MKFIKESNRIFASDESGNIIAEITFLEGDNHSMVINHTFVDDSLRGQGIASKLVQLAVDGNYRKRVYGQRQLLLCKKLA